MSIELEIGSLFAGRYRIMHRIAAGGMGAVYEVEHVETERRRALKVMHAHMFYNDDMRARFKQEAKVAARVDSEFIVDVFDAGIDDTTQMPFLVMELLRGEELGERIKRIGALQPAEVATCIQQVAAALDKTHQASIIHRDLKPDNLFLLERSDGSIFVKVLDFGIAKLVAEGATSAGPTQALGTPLYMAPEQFRANSRLTAAADIYALGMVTYTLLVGAPYWAEEAKGADVVALIAVAAYGPPEPASVRAARRSITLPEGFDAWFAKMTALEASARFDSATTAAVFLRRALGLDSTSNLSVAASTPPLLPTPSPAQPTPSSVTSRMGGASPGMPSPFDTTASGATATKPLGPATTKRRSVMMMSTAVGAVVLLGGGYAAYLATPANTGGATAASPSSPVYPPEATAQQADSAASALAVVPVVSASGQSTKNSDVPTAHADNHIANAGTPVTTPQSRTQSTPKPPSSIATSTKSATTVKPTKHARD